jgi:hypothetical protein
MTRNPEQAPRGLTSEEMSSVSGGATNFETPAGAAFLAGFLAGGGTLGNPQPEAPWPPAGRGDCNTNHNGVKY